MTIGMIPTAAIRAVATAVRRHEREEATELFKPSSLPFLDPRFTESPTDILLCAVVQARRSLSRVKSARLKRLPAPCA
jgi:hypothetical protein